MGLFFKSKAQDDANEREKIERSARSQRHAQRQHNRYLVRVQRKSRIRGEKIAYAQRRRAETMEAQRRVLMGEVDCTPAMRRNVENHVARLMEQQERTAAMQRATADV